MASCMHRGTQGAQRLVPGARCPEGGRFRLRHTRTAGLKCSAARRGAPECKAAEGGSSTSAGRWKWRGEGLGIRWDGSLSAGIAARRPQNGSKADGGLCGTVVHASSSSASAVTGPTGPGGERGADISPPRVLSTVNDRKSTLRARRWDSTGSARISSAVVPRATAGVADASLSETFATVSEWIQTLFPVWSLIAATVGLMNPSFFSFMTPNSFTAVLGLLMFSMGITLTLDDFKRVIQNMSPVLLGFVACYVMMPLLALAVGKAFGISGPLLAGLVLVGSINGGQASNVCTYIARGDVALSVVMTTSTTIGTIFMTPLLVKLLAGAIVPVDPVGIAFSTLQVVLAPVACGVLINKMFPAFCRAVTPFCPIIGVLSTVVLVGGSVAPSATAIIEAGMKLQVALILFHLIGGVLGYWMNKAVGADERTCRTTAIETSMKSSAYGYFLACNHFGSYLARVPSAVSVVWMAVAGASLAVMYRNMPVDEAK